MASGVPREVALADADEHEFFVPESARWPALVGGFNEPGRGAERGRGGDRVREHAAARRPC